MNFVSFKNTKRGFTLIEILVVIAIIGILSSVVLASLATSRAKARDARRIADLEEVKKALELYYDSNGAYPPTDVAPYPLPLVIKTGGFIAQIPVTPAGATAYKYFGGTFSGSTLDTSLPLESFILAGQLERNDAIALTGDADNRAVSGTGTIFEGTATDCGNVTATPQPGGGFFGERCFDIRP